jgi:WD repeat-containing protein 26
VFTVGSSLGLVAVSTWFALERWAYKYHKGKKWLWDILADGYVRFAAFLVQQVTSARRAAASSGSLPDDGLPTTTPGMPRPIEALPSFPVPTGPQVATGSREPSIDIEAASIAEENAELVSLLDDSGRTSLISINRSLDFSNIAYGGHNDPSRQQTVFSVDIPIITELRQKTKTLMLLPRKFEEHRAAVKHIEFSPDGTRLATCSGDQTTLIFSIVKFMRARVNSMTDHVYREDRYRYLNHRDFTIVSAWGAK